MAGLLDFVQMAGLGTQPQQPAMGLLGQLTPYPEFRLSDNIEDRRNDPNPNEPKWENVLPHFKNLMNDMRIRYVSGVPIPEEAAPTGLSRQLGHLDVKIEPNIGSTSPLDYVLYDIENTARTAKGFGRAVLDEFRRERR